jgi:type IV conjugative transfer system coupling protein TraD
MKRHSIKNTTRGGQVILHNLRMIAQVLQKVALWLLPIGLLAAVGWFFLITNPDDQWIGRQWLSAELKLWIHNSHFQQTFVFSSGQTMKVTVGQIISAPFVQKTVIQLQAAAYASVWAGLIVWVLSIIGVLIWLKRRGEAYTAHKPLKGDRLCKASQARKQIIAQNRSSTLDLVFGRERLPLPPSAELQHILVHGTTGTGKSTVIKELLDHIRRRGERAIVYDKSCSLVSHFYQPEQDKLLNPLDQRGADWNIWRECRDKTDYENLAAALIPMTATAQDPFWVNAARTIFAAAASRLHQHTNPRILPLLKTLLTANVGQLQELLKGTEAESLMSEKTEKTAISIKSVLATYLKSLCYIRDIHNPFSIRQWIHDDQAKQWLFISSTGDRHESLKPLISAWLDIAINALLSLPENRERRIWVILDELGSLQQLPYLTSALAEARKFGGCFVIGVQSAAQLAKTYGFEGGREISSLLNTRFIFRAPDPEIAQWSSRNLGETLIEEVREGISYGANTIRDGVSIQKIEVQKPVVSPSEILQLNNLMCYMRVPGAYPITQLHMKPFNRKASEEGFKLRPFEPDPLLREMEKLSAAGDGSRNSAPSPATTSVVNPAERVPMDSASASPSPSVQAEKEAQKSGQNESPASGADSPSHHQDAVISENREMEDPCDEIE